MPPEHKRRPAEGDPVSSAGRRFFSDCLAGVCRPNRWKENPATALLALAGKKRRFYVTRHLAGIFLKKCRDP